MSRRILTVLAALVIASTITADSSPPPTSNPSSILPLSFRIAQSIASDGKSIQLAKSSTNLQEPGRPVVFSARGTPLAFGNIEYSAFGTSTVRLTWIGVLPAPGFDAILPPWPLAPALLDHLPDRCSFSCRVIEIAPNGRSCRLDATESDGFRIGDQLWIIRARLPITRLTIQRFERIRAAATCTPLAANVTPVIGDRARLSPSPGERRTGRLRSSILRVQPRGSDHEIWFPLDPSDGAVIGDRFNIRDDAGLVGLCALSEFRGPFAVAHASAPFCRRAPAVGDRVERRDLRDIRSGRAPLRMFRVEGNYALIDAGEDDGLVRGQRLTFYREGRVVGAATATNVKTDFCGVTLDRTTSGPTSPVQIGDLARTRPPPPSSAIGRIDWLAAENRIAFVRFPESSAVRPGEMVEIGAESDPAAAIVMSAAPGRATLFLPHQAGGTGVETAAPVRQIEP